MMHFSTSARAPPRPLLPQHNSYVPIKDASFSVLSAVEADFVRSTASAPSRSSSQRRGGTSSCAIRVDGRRPEELRPCRLHLSRSASSGGFSDTTSSASATVHWGSGTRALATVEGELVPPFPDRPNEGMITLSVDLSCGASPRFRHSAPAQAASGGPTSSTSTSSAAGAMDGEQKRVSNRILRCLERLVVQGGALDAEALCVVPSRWVWRLHVSVTVLDAAGGNLMDAAVLACWAALRHYRRPHVQINDNSSNANSVPTLIPVDYKDPDPLPLHHTPLTVSFGMVLIDDSSQRGAPAAGAGEGRRRPNTVAALVDPNDREERVASGCLTLAGNIHGEILMMDFVGGGTGSFGGGSTGSSESSAALPLSSRRCCELTTERLRECYTVAAKLLPELCRLLDDSLTRADEQWRSERLHRLQKDMQGIDPKTSVASASNVGGGDNDEVDVDDDLTTIRAQQDGMEVDDDAAITGGRGGESVSVAATKQILRAAELQAEEAYRRQALDYNAGHFAIPIKDDDKGSKSGQGATESSKSELLSFLLESASSASGTAASLPAAPPVTGLHEPTLASPPLQKPTQPERAAEKHGTVPPVNLSHGRDAYVMSDDEDEGLGGTSMELESEFTRSRKADDQPVSMPSSAVETVKPTPRGSSVSTGPVGMDTAAAVDDDDDVDDLAAAIKVKSKKKKGKKK